MATCECKCQHVNGFHLFMDWVIGCLIASIILVWIVSGIARHNIKDHGYNLPLVIIDGTVYSGTINYDIQPVSRDVDCWNYFVLLHYRSVPDLKPNESYYLTMEVHKKGLWCSFHVRPGEMVIWNGHVWQIKPCQDVKCVQKILNNDG